MIKLTQTVQKGGCAAKIAASELRQILAQVHFPPRPPELLVDGSLFDDAAIVQITPDLALVQTLDFFTPIVDQPRAFGAVATANALSDVYAMGGTPQTALAILAYPLASVARDVVVEVLQGACDVLTRAKVALVGGHSIDDDTLKFGLSVTGHVHPKKVWANSGAKVGDHLILTKALGTGTLAAGLKRQAYEQEAISDAVTSMMQLNCAPQILGPLTAHVHAATDITGFGLAGHAMQMAKASHVSLKIKADSLPVFSKAWETLALGYLTKAHQSNRLYTQSELNSQLTDQKNLILFDPQTSGGLLLSVDPHSTQDILTALSPEFPHASYIGEVGPEQEKALQVEA